MKFFNDFDIAMATQRHPQGTIQGRAARFLEQLKEETNRCSDGWAYWSKPCRAAQKLIELIEKGGDQAALRKALIPVKSFYTRYGYKAGMKYPTTYMGE